jgi:hypothetical protein
MRGAALTRAGAFIPRARGHAVVGNYKRNQGTLYPARAGARITRVREGARSALHRKTSTRSNSQSTGAPNQNFAAICSISCHIT